MFYANFVLAKKGPLARVWLAAHWEKKLSKAHVFETDLQSSVDSIMAPKVKIALRTSGHLLLGVVRIYSRKAKYLLADCSEALVKIKMAFRPDIVDLPLDNQRAAVSTITLPEVQEWDVMMTDLGDYDITATLSKNQCRVEEITMKEDLISSRFLSDDNFFGDTQFGEEIDKEIMRDDATLNESINMQDLSKTQVLDETTLKDKSTLSISQANIDFNMGEMDDGGFGAGEGLDFLDGFGMEANEIAGLEDLDAQAPLDPILDSTITKTKDEILLEDEVTKASETKDREEIKDISEAKKEEQEKKDEELVEEISAVMEDTTNAVPMETDIPEQTTEMGTVNTTLFTRDTEAFALEPVEVTVGKEKRKRRKRKLVVDEEKMIVYEQMKARIAHPEDIVKAAQVAPATKSRMRYCDIDNKKLQAEQISFPCCKRSKLMSIYKNNLTHKIPTDLDIPSSQEEEEEIELEPPIETLRDNDNQEELPEITNELTDIEKTNQEEEYPLLEEFEEIPPPEVPLGVDELEAQHFNEETKGDEELTIPPAFELEKSLDKSFKGNDTEEEEEESQETDTDKQDTKRWTKRTQQTLNLLEKQWKKKDQVQFKDITKKCNRKQAAHKFYTLLILSKTKSIKFQQEEVFGDITIERGEMLSK